MTSTSRAEPDAVVNDPAADPAELAEIAGQRSDLHPAILAHPACYAELREWILAQQSSAESPSRTPAALLRTSRKPLSRRTVVIVAGGMVLVALVVAAIIVGAALSRVAGIQNEIADLRSEIEELR